MEIGSKDTGTRYTARDGKVYADDGTEAGTARSANGRELERHAAALDQARAQRDAAELDVEEAMGGYPWPNL